MNSSDNYQKVNPEVEMDILLWGHSYTTRDGQRLNPMRLKIEAHVTDKNKWVVDGYSYLLESGEEIFFSPEQMHRRIRL